jgi:hypothetical protein
MAEVSNRMVGCSSHTAGRIIRMADSPSHANKSFNRTAEPSSHTGKSSSRTVFRQKHAKNGKNRLFSPSSRANCSKRDSSESTANHTKYAKFIGGRPQAFAYLAYFAVQPASHF